jgi:hypothetical protein
MNNYKEKHEHKHGHRTDKDKHRDMAIQCQYSKERVLRSTATIQRSPLMKRRSNRLSQWRINILRRLRRLISSRRWYSVIITSTWYSARSVAAECEKVIDGCSYLRHFTSFWLASLQYPSRLMLVQLLGSQIGESRFRFSCSITGGDIQELDETRNGQDYLFPPEFNICEYKDFQACPAIMLYETHAASVFFCILSSVFRSYNWILLMNVERTLFIC